MECVVLYGYWYVSMASRMFPQAVTNAFHRTLWPSGVASREAGLGWVGGPGSGKYQGISEKNLGNLVTEFKKLGYRIYYLHF